MALAKLVYERTARLPESERFGLVVQMRRAAVSIPSNIAEGFGRETTSDLIRLLRISRGSLFELRTQCRLCADLGFIDEADVPVDALAECDRVLQALIRSLADHAKSD